MQPRRSLLMVGFLSLARIVHNEERPEWVRHVIAEGFSNQTAVAADFTGDGRLDVITGDITPNGERTILYVAPDWKPVVLHMGIRTIHGAIIDVDGDGKPDFVGARYHPGLVYWLERPADPLHDPWPYHLADDSAQGGADGVHGLWAGDIDGDGKIDLAASSGQPKGGVPDSLVWFRIPSQPRTAARWERYALADRDAPGGDVEAISLVAGHRPVAAEADLLSLAEGDCGQTSPREQFVEPPCGSPRAGIMRIERQNAALQRERPRRGSDRRRQGQQGDGYREGPRGFRRRRWEIVVQTPSTPRGNVTAIASTITPYSTMRKSPAN